MPQTAQRLATYQDLLDLPDRLVGEIINGVLYTQPRPAPRHARCSSGLGAKLANPYDYGEGGPGGWWILDEPELHLAEDILVPDLAGWRRERMPTLPETAWFGLAPDWICEVLSPGSVRKDRTLKMHKYAQHEVQWLWIIDPIERYLEAYELRGGAWTLFATRVDNDPVRLKPFDATEFMLDALWA